MANGNITELWEGLREAGMPEVMLFLPDNTACRCHWDDTALVGNLRVALLADQERKIVRIVPVDQCIGIGIASPKGTDPSNQRGVIHAKLAERFTGVATVSVPQPRASAAGEPAIRRENGSPTGLFNPRAINR